MFEWRSTPLRNSISKTLKSMRLWLSWTSRRPRATLSHAADRAPRSAMSLHAAWRTSGRFGTRSCREAIAT